VKLFKVKICQITTAELENCPKILRCIICTIKKHEVDKDLYNSKVK